MSQDKLGLFCHFPQSLAVIGKLKNKQKIFKTIRGSSHDAVSNNTTFNQTQRGVTFILNEKRSMCAILYLYISTKRLHELTAQIFE
jgi:hypothetical protein